MAEIKSKPEQTEKALLKLVSQLDKDVNKRVLQPGAWAAIITYIAENCGAKFPDADSRNTFRKLLAEDSDLGYISNLRKYMVSRKMLPEKPETSSQSFA